MARYERATDTYVGDSRITGFPRRQKRGFLTEEDARQWEKDRRLRLLFPERAQTLLKLSTACSTYLKHCRRQKMALNTIRDKANVLKQMAMFAGPELLLKETKTYHISNFLDAHFDKRADEYAEWEAEERRLEKDPTAKRNKGIPTIPIDPGKNTNSPAKRVYGETCTESSNLLLRHKKLRGPFNGPFCFLG